MTRAQTWLKGYYLATPVFILLDLFWDWNIRAAGLRDFPVLKWLYYALCLGCAVLWFRQSPYAGLASFVETIASLFVLFIGFVYPYFKMVGAEDVTAVQNLYTTQYALNFILTGGCTIAIFHRQVNSLGLAKPY
jgi:hypothetical protein